MANLEIDGQKKLQAKKERDDITQGYSQYDQQDYYGDEYYANEADHFYPNTGFDPSIVQDMIDQLKNNKGDEVRFTAAQL